MKHLTRIQIQIHQINSMLMTALMAVPGPVVIGAISLFAVTGAEARLGSVRGEVRQEARQEVRGTARRTARRTTRRVVRRTGRRVATLGAGASLVHIGGLPYYSWGGSYYQREGDVYIEVIVD